MLLKETAAYAKTTCRTPPATNDRQHAVRKAFDPIAERIKGLVKQADMLFKLAARAVDSVGTLTPPPSPTGRGDKGEGLRRMSLPAFVL